MEDREIGRSGDFHYYIKNQEIARKSGGLQSVRVVCARNGSTDMYVTVTVSRDELHHQVRLAGDVPSDVTGAYVISDKLEAATDTVEFMKGALIDDVDMPPDKCEPTRAIGQS